MRLLLSGGLGRRHDSAGGRGAAGSRAAGSQLASAIPAIPAIPGSPHPAAADISQK